MESNNITLYGASWCPDCKRARDLLDRNQISYQYIDIENTPGAADKVTEINNGLRRIPTILFPDNSILVEPSNKELLDKISSV